MTAIAGRRSLVKVTGAAVAFTNEATTANVARTIYTITAASKNVWDRATTVTVEESADGSTGWAAPVGTYTVNRLTGQITFAVARTSGHFIRVSGDYLPLSVAAGCKEFSYVLMANNLDNTDFDSANTNGGFRTRQQCMHDANGTLGQWDQADSYFTDTILAGAPVVIEFFTDRSTTYDLRAWALLEKRGLQSAFNGLVETSVDWVGAPDADGRVISG